MAASAKNTHKTEKPPDVCIKNIDHVMSEAENTHNAYILTQHRILFCKNPLC